MLALPSDPFEAEVSVPGDKSLGHRGLILAAMAEGRSHVKGLPDGADIGSTRDVLRGLGIQFDGPTITSPGFGAWSPPTDSLDCGNSGTTMRLMAGALSAASFTVRLIGDASLSRRPMRRLVDPLGALGARIEVSPAGTAPVTVRGRALTGGPVHIPVASAQVRTSVALAGLNATGTTVIDSPGGFRDHTERWLEALGRGDRQGDTRFVVRPGELTPLDVSIPGDPSSAAFLWAAAAVRAGSRVTTPGVSLNAGRLGFLSLLDEMGGTVEVVRTGDVLGDPIGDVTVSAAPLRGISVSGTAVAAAIDEIPLLAVVAAAAKGRTTVTDAAELRAKESDRIRLSVALARLAGAAARETTDGFEVGRGEQVAADRIDSEGDHRIAMAAAIASIARGSSVAVDRFEACAVSWPGFPSALERLWS